MQCTWLPFPLQSWGTELDTNNGRIHDFLEQLEKFVNSLVGARGNMEGHVTLADTDIGIMLDGMRSAADYQAAGGYYSVLDLFKITGLKRMFLTVLLSSFSIFFLLYGTFIITVLSWISLLLDFVPKTCLLQISPLFIK